jgi:hypothetical protein
LDLRACQIGAAGARALCEALRKNTSLRVLSLEGNDIGEALALSLSLSLSLFPSLFIFISISLLSTSVARE